MKNKTTQDIIKALDEKYSASGQDKNMYLEGLLHSKPMNYWDYIHTCGYRIRFEVLQTATHNRVTKT